MPFSDLTDLRRSKKVLCGLTDVDITTTNPNPDPDLDVIAGCRAAADAEISGYLSKRYPLPLTLAPEGVPPIIRNASGILTLYNLYGRKDSRPKTIEDDAAGVRTILEQIRKGDIDLFELDPVEDIDGCMGADECRQAFSPAYFRGR